jgi:hypothetical protein
MGFKRKTYRGVFALALLAGAPAVSGATLQEPVVVTPLGDPEQELVPVSAPAAAPSLEQRIAEFSRAVSQANAAEGQAIEAQCKSTAAAAAKGADRFAWAANCRYQRR